MDKLQRKSDIQDMAKRQLTEPSQISQPEISLDAILSFLKDTRGTVSWSAKDLRNCLKLDAKQVQQSLAILEMQGYIAKEGDQWLTTSAGETISQSKKPQFSAASVIKAIDTLKERIEAVNRDKRAKYRIAKAVAFGDFLSGRLEVQAADVGVELSPNVFGNQEELEQLRLTMMAELRRKSRLFSVRKYRAWMSRRSHRALL